MNLENYEAAHLDQLLVEFSVEKKDNFSVLPQAANLAHALVAYLAFSSVGSLVDEMGLILVAGWVERMAYVVDFDLVETTAEKRVFGQQKLESLVHWIVRKK